MSRRYYLTPIVGSGTFADPYRAKAEQYGNCSTVIPTGADGRPLFAWALCVVASPDHAAPRADAALTPFPAAVSLDTLWSSFSNQQRNRVTTFLANQGVSTASLTAGSTVRDVLRLVGRALDPSFAESALGVGE